VHYDRLGDVLDGLVNLALEGEPGLFLPELIWSHFVEYFLKNKMSLALPLRSQQRNKGNWGVYFKLFEGSCSCLG